MGELGIYAEHGTADKATCNIPMIIKWPGLAGGRVDSGLHYNIDLLPTLCDLLGVDPSEHWDGKSFYPELTDSEVESGHPYVVISQNAHVCQRSVRFGKWLYMRTIHDGYHLFEREMLFNLEEDPYEQQNLMEAYPEVAAMGARYILNWQEEQMAKNPHLPDPMWTVMSEGGPYHTHVDLSPYLQRLKDTGRVEGAERLFAKHGLGWSKK